MQDRNHDFFRPLWRRIAITLVCVGWFVWEVIGGDNMWMMLTGAITAYAIWTFLISYKSGGPPE